MREGVGYEDRANPTRPMRIKSTGSALDVNRPPALYRLRVKTHTAGPYGLFRKLKSPYEFIFPVWVYFREPI